MNSSAKTSTAKKIQTTTLLSFFKVSNPKPHEETVKLICNAANEERVLKSNEVCGVSDDVCHKTEPKTTSGSNHDHEALTMVLTDYASSSKLEELLIGQPLEDFTHAQTTPTEIGIIRDAQASDIHDKEEDEQVSNINDDTDEFEVLPENEEGLSEYELLRLERIQRNAAFLESLGLEGVKPQSRAEKTKSSGVKRKRPVSSCQAPPPRTLPTRQSSRTRAVPETFNPDPSSSSSSSSSLSKATPSPATAFEGEEDFGDSAVLTYLVGAAAEAPLDLTAFAFRASSSAAVAQGPTPNCSGGQKSGGGRAEGGGACVPRLRQGPAEPLRAAGGKGGRRFYSLDGDPTSGLLAAGGQGGRVCVFRFAATSGAAGDGRGQGESEGEGGRAGDEEAGGGREGGEGTNGGVREGGLGPGGQRRLELLEGGDGPLVSFQPHGSTWVSEVLFCGGSEGRAGKLLTSANDGCVALWDLTKSSKGLPRGLGPKLPWHGKSSIWSMHTVGGIIATGSKDGSVGFGRLTATGLALDTSVDLDDGNVKGVHIQTTSSSLAGGVGLVAAAGEGGTVHLLDLRDPRTAQGRLALGCAAGACHAGGAVSVEWRPGAEHELLSCGLDKALKLWDARSPRAPLRAFEGHVPCGARAAPKGIIRPRWLTRGFDCGGSGGGSGGPALTIAVQGWGSTKLTLFEAETGAVLSRGELGEAVTAMAQVAAGPCLAVAHEEGDIKLLVPSEP